MRTGGENTRRRATVPEIVGAWLRVWTPPRDVDIPPVPVRKLLLAAVAVLALAGGAYAVIAPQVDDAKRRAAAREQRERTARRAAERLRVIAEQRPRRERALALLPPSGSPPARRRRARAALLTDVERRISADAKARAQAGELRGRPGATECSPYPPREAGARPEEDLDVRTGVYDCLVLVREIRATETNVGGRLGYPFRAVIDFESFRFAWCKTNPIPGERVVPDPRTVVELPRACRAR